MLNSNSFDNDIHFWACRFFSSVSKWLFKWDVWQYSKSSIGKTRSAIQTKYSYTFLGGGHFVTPDKWGGGLSNRLHLPNEMPLFFNSSICYRDTSDFANLAIFPSWWKRCPNQLQKWCAPRPCVRDVPKIWWWSDFLRNLSFITDRWTDTHRLFRFESHLFTFWRL